MFKIVSLQFLILLFSIITRFSNAETYPYGSGYGNNFAANGYGYGPSGYGNTGYGGYNRPGIYGGYGGFNPSGSFYRQNNNSLYKNNTTKPTIVAIPAAPKVPDNLLLEFATRQSKEMSLMELRNVLGSPSPKLEQEEPSSPAAARTPASVRKLEAWPLLQPNDFPTLDLPDGRSHTARE